jgi:hypothetical protein
MNETDFLVQQTMATITCCKCGVLFGVPKNWAETFKLTHQQFFCPAGHAQRYLAVSDKDRLERELADERERLRVALLRRDSALQEAEHFRRSRDCMKGMLKKVSIRAKNGVCPCCKRTFSCLAAHMKSKHPEFSAEPK